MLTALQGNANLTSAPKGVQDTLRMEHSPMMTLNDRGIPKPPLDMAQEKLEHPDILDDAFWRALALVHDYTELPTAVLYNLYCAVRYVVESSVPGDMVECGVHMGGSVMMIEHVLQFGDTLPGRRVFALDTFSGFVRRTDDLDVDQRTGAAVCHPEADVDYGAGSIENMRSIGYDGLRIVKGDVLETIPTMDVDRISLLRLDTDTYDTTKFELEQLYDRVSPGGAVIVDDYGYTFGCKKAVDDFIRGRKVFLKRINPNVRSWVKVD